MIPDEECEHLKMALVELSVRLWELDDLVVAVLDENGASSA